MGLGRFDAPCIMSANETHITITGAVPESMCPRHGGAVRY